LHHPRRLPASPLRRSSLHSDRPAAVRLPVGVLRPAPEYQSDVQPNRGDSLPRLRGRLRWHSGRGVPVFPRSDCGSRCIHFRGSLAGATSYKSKTISSTRKKEGEASCFT